MPERIRVRATHILVLRRRDVADADRVLTVLTPGEGKLELLAKGVRKTASRKSGHLEPFAHAHVMIAQARTWDIITEAVTVESFRHLRDNLDAIGRAAYLCELADCFSETGDENRLLWELLLFALRVLDGEVQSVGTEEGVNSLDATAAANLLRWFDLQLLSLAGFQPQLFNCLACDAELEPVLNFFSTAEGGVFCPRCGPLRNDVEPIEPDVLKVLRYIQAKPWPDVAVLRIRPGIARNVDNLLLRYLRQVLERNVRSADFLRRLEHVRMG